MTKKIVLLCMLSLACTMSGCWFTDWLNSIFGTGYCTADSPIPNIPFVAIYPNPDTGIYRGTIGGTGHGTFPKKSPATGNVYQCWQITVVLGQRFGFSLTASPSSADLTAPPSSVTISGQAMDATYGMPLVEYFDGQGYLIGSINATAVAGDGSWLTAPAPDLSSVYSGTYQIQVTNMTSGGYYLDIVGAATMWGYGRDRPDSDGDGWYDDEDCAPYDPSLNYDCSQNCNTNPIPMECNAY